MRFRKNGHLGLPLLSFLFGLAACGGGGGGGGGNVSPPPAATYTVGGTVTGLTGDGLTLQNNGGNDLSVADDGNFVFSALVSDGASYVVTVSAQPSNPNQFCTVTNGSGTASASVGGVSITCETVQYSVGGNVTGLPGANGLVLQVNGGDELPIAADGAFTFGTALDDFSAYEVTVLTEPTATPAVDCAVNDGIGRIAGAAVTNVRVICNPIVDLYAANGVVTSLALSEDGTTLYFGGDFTKVGPATGTFVAIDGNSGQVTSSPGELFGPATFAAAPDGNGGWYVGGYYDDFESHRWPDSLVHVLPDGSVDPNWNPDPDGTVTEIAVSGSTVYVAGFFDNIGGQSRAGFAALDATTGQATDWNPGPSSNVPAVLQVSGDTLYVAQSGSLKAFDLSTGLQTAWDPEISGGVHAIAVSGNTVYVGGRISSAGGEAREGLAAFDAGTGTPVNWAPSVNEFSLFGGGGSSVDGIIVDGDTVYIAGDFVEIEGQARNGLAAVDATTGAITPWDPNVSGWVESIALSGGVIYATGYFHAIGGEPRDFLGAVDAATGQVTAWDPNPSGRGHLVTTVGDTVYVGGTFVAVGGSTRNRLAAIDTATGALTAWNPGADDRVEAVAVAGNTVYVGGEFLNVGGAPRSRLASIDAMTGVANPWAPNPDRTVLSIAADGDTVYAGGRFTALGGEARNRLAAIDSTSGVVTSWDPNVSDVVRAIAVSGDTVFIGGEFSFVDGQERVSVAALDAATGAATTWDPDLIAFTFDIEVAGNTVYLGTEFTSFDPALKSLHAFDASTGEAVGPDINAFTPVYSISVVGNTLYYATFQGLGAVNLVTGTPTPFSETLHSNVESIVATESVVYAGGVFTRIPGKGGSRIGAFPR